MKNIEDFKIGQIVEYSFFNNVSFEGVDNFDEVVLKDKNGNIKKYQKDYF